MKKTTLFIAILISLLLAGSMEFIAWRPGGLPEIQAFAYSGLFTLAIFLLFYSITNKFSFAWVLNLSLLVPLFFTNHEKHSFLGMPVIGSDIDVLQEGFSIWIKHLSTNDLILFVAFFTLWGIILFLSWKYMPHLRASNLIRKILAVFSCLYLIASTAFILFTGNYSINAPYSNYKKIGFITSFNASLWSYLFQGYPELINDKQAQDIFDSLGLVDDPIVDQAIQPDIVVVVSESFFNPSLLENIEFEPRDITPILNKLRQNNPLNLYSPVFGGATPSAEFEILTGYPHVFVSNLTNPLSSFCNYYSIPTLVFHLRDLGYKTTYIHPNSGYFFNINVTTFNLGFENLISIEKMKYIQRRNNYWVGDDQMLHEARDILQNDSDEPKFIYMMSIQNHTPYSSEHYLNYPDVKKVNIKNSDLPTDIQKQIEGFATGIHFSDASMQEFVTFIKNRKKPTLLVFTPDHLPPLPDNEHLFNDLYQQNDKFKTIKNPRLKRYSIEGFVYSNYRLPKKVPDEPMSQFFIPKFILDWAGLPKNKFFNFVDKIYSKHKILHFTDSKEMIEQSSFKDDLLGKFKKITFYNILGKRGKSLAKNLEMVSMHDFFIQQFSSDFFIIAIREEATRRLSSNIISIIKKAGGRIDELHYYGSYVAVFKKGNLVKESLSNNGDVVEIDTIIDGVTINATSKAGKIHNSFASIKINGVEHSVMGRGLAVAAKNEKEIQYATFNSWRHKNQKRIISKVKLPE